jgi:hypothetical protein
LRTGQSYNDEHSYLYSPADIVVERAGTSGYSGSLGAKRLTDQTGYWYYVDFFWDFSTTPTITFGDSGAYAQVLGQRVTLASQAEPTVIQGPGSSGPILEIKSGDEAGTPRYLYAEGTATAQPGLHMDNGASVYGLPTPLDDAEAANKKYVDDSALSGYSGYSGYSGSGVSGYSGYCGLSGYSGAGTSGYSGYSGTGAAYEATAVVSKNGNDLNPTGPFLTIGAAVTYLTTTFALSASQHGLVQIMPGTYTEQIGNSATGEVDFIDYFGWSKDTVIITSATSPTANFSSSTGANQISNLTLACTDTGDATKYTLQASDGAVRFNTCKITSLRRIIETVGANVILADCLLETTGSGVVVSAITTVNGKMYNCQIEGNALANESELCNFGSSTCYFQGCTFLSTASADVRGFRECQGYFVNCLLKTSGYTFLTIGNNCKFANSWLECNGYGSCANRVVSTAYFAGCTLYSSSSGYRVVNSFQGTAINCCFYGPTYTGNQVFIDADNAAFYNCTVITAAGAGTPLWVNQLGKQITVGGVVATNSKWDNFNWLNDRSSTFTKAYFPGQGMKDGYQGWFINPAGAGIATAGANLSTVGTTAGANGTDGSWTSFTSGAATNDEAGLLEPGYNSCRPSNTYRFTCKFKLGQTTDCRLWAGLFSGDPMASVTPSINYAAIRYDSATDTNFMFVNDSGSGTPTATDSGVAVDTAIHSLEIVVNTTTTAGVWFKLDSGTPVWVTATQPTATTDWGAVAKIRTLTTATKAFSFGGAELRWSY